MELFNRLRLYKRNFRLQITSNKNKLSIKGKEVRY